MRGRSGPPAARTLHEQEDALEVQRPGKQGCLELLGIVEGLFDREQDAINGTITDAVNAPIDAAVNDAITDAIDDAINDACGRLTPRASPRSPSTKEVEDDADDGGAPAG